MFTTSNIALTTFVSAAVPWLYRTYVNSPYRDKIRVSGLDKNGEPIEISWNVTWRNNQDDHNTLRQVIRETVLSDKNQFDQSRMIHLHENVLRVTDYNIRAGYKAAERGLERSMAENIGIMKEFQTDLIAQKRELATYSNQLAEKMKYFEDYGKRLSGLSDSLVEAANKGLSVGKRGSEKLSGLKDNLLKAAEDGRLACEKGMTNLGEMTNKIDRLHGVDGQKVTLTSDYVRLLDMVLKSSFDGAVLRSHANIEIACDSLVSRNEISLSMEDLKIQVQNHISTELQELAQDYLDNATKFLSLVAEFTKEFLIVVDNHPYGAGLVSSIIMMIIFYGVTVQRSKFSYRVMNRYVKRYIQSKDLKVLRHFTFSRIVAYLAFAVAAALYSDKTYVLLPEKIGELATRGHNLYLQNFLQVWDNLIDLASYHLGFDVNLTIKSVLIVLSLLAGKMTYNAYRQLGSSHAEEPKRLVEEEDFPSVSDRWAESHRKIVDDGVRWAEMKRYALAAVGASEGDDFEESVNPHRQHLELLTEEVFERESERREYLAHLLAMDESRTIEKVSGPADVSQSR